MKKIYYLGLASLSLLALSCSQTETAANAGKTSTTQANIDTNDPTLKNILKFDENGVGTASQSNTTAIIPALDNDSKTLADRLFAKSTTSRSPGQGSIYPEHTTWRLEGIWGFGGYEPRRGTRNIDIYMTTYNDPCGNGKLICDIRMIWLGSSAEFVRNQKPNGTWIYNQIYHIGYSGNNDIYRMSQINFAGNNALVNGFNNVQGPFGANYVKATNFLTTQHPDKCTGRNVDGSDCRFYFVDDSAQNGGRKRLDIYVDGGVPYGMKNTIWREIHDASSYGFQYW